MAYKKKGGTAKKRKRDHEAHQAELRGFGEALPDLEAHGGSMLSALLLYCWSWGMLSLPFAQKIASAAKGDLAKFNGHFEDLDLLAGMGASGRYPGNMERDLLRSLEKPDMTASRFLVPTKLNKTTVADRVQGVLLPHVQFANIYHHYPEQWTDYICPAVEVVEDFWEAMADHPLMKSTPLRHREGGYKSNGIAIRIHGDDVPVTGVGKCWQKPSTILSWTSPGFVCECGQAGLYVYVYTNPVPLGKNKTVYSFVQLVVGLP
jgi:hypothetical protein